MTETLNAAHYTIRETRQSRIDPDITIDVDIAIRCPRCKTHLPLLKHGHSQKCEKCGLTMELWGNALVCT